MMEAHEAPAKIHYICQTYVETKAGRDGQARPDLADGGHLQCADGDPEPDRSGAAVAGGLQADA